MTVLMLNGVLVAADKATMPATDRALTHGLGLYETLKLVDGVPVFFDEHVKRLESGMDALGLQRPCTVADLAEQICRLAEASEVLNGACRLLVTAGPPDGKPGLLIQTDVRVFPARPLRVVAFRGVRVSAQFKAMTVMQSYLAQQAAARSGADDAILVDDEGRIFEGATSNVFILRGGGLLTTPAEGAILPGVMRAEVEKVARAGGIPVVEAYARVADLRADDGMLLTSSVRGIVAVESVDGHRLRVDGELAGRLRALVADDEAASVAAFRAAYL
jgi:branched-subunit amino acid aminotransferase/4-amino-4-deoxychorismate lyase